MHSTQDIGAMPGQKPLQILRGETIELFIIEYLLMNSKTLRNLHNVALNIRMTNLPECAQSLNILLQLRSVL